ncbi:hypothetical protein [Brevibacillus dissolubilis]|uniref:hypothetical protein n=1 Tax=Brevibacillus dissolubilis TaxID=1844116 RepID=UPI001116A637|nr:hypothetical protein [Brevibacillus dissolubilis]
MGALRKADYYYGALLSVLINSGLVPALFEKDNEKRQIYKITTNKDNYIIYSKYHTSPTGTKNFSWAFTFTEAEIEEIKELKKHSGKVVFALICSQKQLNDYNQEIAIVSWDEFIQCVQINKQEYKGSPRLSVRLMKGSHYLRIYGSGRADMLGNQDNTIKIERNRLSSL